jgi:mRNA-degrading endonuclease toxin of MazEF toxin-antitoxin module
MTSFEAGDVVRVLFPHVESNVQRYRPALVVTRQPVGPDGLLIWVAMITSAERKRWPADVEIEDHGAMGLPIPSVIRTAKIATLETEGADKIGSVTQPLLASVQLRIREHLGLT